MRAMTETPPGAPEVPADEPELSVRHRIVARLRNYLIAGVLVTAPIGLTVYLAWTFIHWMDEKVMVLIPTYYHPETYLPFSIPGLGLFIVVAGLILIGALTANLLGRTFIHMYERILHRMPVIRGIYTTLKQVFETVFNNQSEAFREVVMIEYPRRGLWALGFLTGPTIGEVQHLTQEKVLNIFLPTTPNPTSGFLLFVPQEDVIVLKMTVEEGIKMVMSGGIVTPPDPRPKAEQMVPKVSAKTHQDLDILREKQNALPRR
jgi:uncharacterized membrane protein